MPTKKEMLWRLEVRDPQRFTEWRPLWAFGEDQLVAAQELVVELNRINAPVQMRVILLNQIEVRISRLVERARSEGAICCSQESVRDMAERPMTAVVRMRCKKHGTYSFKVRYGTPATESGRDDAALKRVVLRVMLKSVVRATKKPKQETLEDLSWAKRRWEV